MKRLVYTSEAKIGFSESDLTDLSERATVKNKELNVTGYLCYSKSRFIQYIEGQDEVIDTLIDRIRNDVRHKFIYEIESNKHEDRLFPSWNMRYLKLDELIEHNLNDMIENWLIVVKNNVLNKEQVQDNIWQHVNSIAKIHDLLKSMPC